jgi:hypothetical protein
MHGQAPDARLLRWHKASLSRLWWIGAGGRNRTDTPFGNGILSAARLPVPPRPQSCRHSSANRSRSDGGWGERHGGLF